MLLCALLAAVLLPPQQSQLLAPARRLHPVPARDVHLAEDSFWGPRVATNLATSLLHGARMLEEHGQFGNFRLAAHTLGHRLPAGDKVPAGYSGCFYYDSDAYKWLEACCLALQQQPPEGPERGPAVLAQAELRGLVDLFVEEIAAAQRDDGYIQTQYVVEGWTPFSKLGSDHELYCAGHLIQAAIAHHDATGSRRLLDVALKFAELLDRTFGSDTAAGQRPGCCGHPEIETALVQLYRHTGERRWLDLASFFLECRGQGLAGGDEYRQDDKPIREQREARGHAVRQLYLCSGELGVGAETGDAGLVDANLAIWDDIVRGKLYLTGGLGARPDGEAFGAAFELPNERAYSETCASVAWMRWNDELLQATGDARFADALETTLYNAFLASTSFDGTSFFYVNPLESRGGVQREPWYWCACCPPNVMRTFAGLPGWIASTGQETLWIHLYDDCTIDATLGDGRKVKVAVETGWPWEGRVRVRVLEAPQGDFKLALRIPGWAHDIAWEPTGGLSGLDAAAQLSLAERRLTQPTCYALARVHIGPVTEERPWWASLSTGDAAAGPVASAAAPGDGAPELHPVIEWSTPFTPEWIAADPRVADDAGLCALMRGPLVYAFESLDQADGRVGELLANPQGAITIERGVAPGGGDRLLTAGFDRPRPAQQTLYAADASATRPISLVAIPYHAWAQRGDSAMRVWIPAVAHETDVTDDIAFLREHADALVLRAADGGPVVVSPRLSGRVMTSAFGDDQPGFGLVNRPAILAGPVTHGFANYGGEDRLWLSPEGGPWALFFPPGAQQVPEAWSVPRAIDGGPRTLANHDGTSATFQDLVEFSNAAGGRGTLRVERGIEALDRAAVAGLLGLPLPKDVQVVAFRSTNRAVWADAPPDGLVGLWTLGQFTPGNTTSVLFPFRGDARAECIKSDYFGDVPGDRLQITLPAAPDGFGLARFTADSRLRSKIGLSRAGATGWIGAWDEARGVLTLVNHTVPARGVPVPDCDWKADNPHAAEGDVATSYNHGGDPGFFELESLSAAMPQVPGGFVEHVSTTIHLGGDRDVLRGIAHAVLHADL